MVATFIILMAKFITRILRTFGLGGGTSLPGVFVEKYYPQLIKKISINYKTIVLISGTNGKTTTQTYLRHLLEGKEIKVTSNQSGANLFRGIATTLISDCSFSTKPRSTIAILEVEEATMPILTKYLSASYIIVTNLFRDQLDVYGEVITTREYIINAIKNNPNAKVFLNSDDKNVLSISAEIKNQITTYQVDSTEVKSLFYERDFTHTKVKKKFDEIHGKNIILKPDLSTSFTFESRNKSYPGIHFIPPGIQNVYNAVSAIGVALSVANYTVRDLRRLSDSFYPAFGRGEIVHYNDKHIRLLLIKNPASFTATLRMIKHRLDVNLWIIINDKIADGTDVSWLWDAQIELLQKAKIGNITVSGTRASDMALRLKYADIPQVKTEVIPNLNRALDISLSKLKDGETLFVLPTYTAMLEVRKHIQGIVKIKNFWE